MRIACLGWGSLVWDPRTLPVDHVWNCDGPLLPIEFSRESNDKRLTLAITPGANPLHVLWTEMHVGGLPEAKLALAEREGIPGKNVGRDVEGCTRDCTTREPLVNAIAAWAQTKGLDAVIWTALPPKFHSQVDLAPTEQEAVQHLNGLTGDTGAKAEEYVRKTPQQIRTKYRRAIEDALGWTPMSKLYATKVKDIVERADEYHEAYYDAETFHGPSLHFHRRALEQLGEQGFDRHLEYIYAALTAWGMHRMGKGGSKMRPFEDFKGSVEPMKDTIRQAVRLKWYDMTHDNWLLLECLFRGIKVMASGTTLIGNSKVLAHIVPEMVPPIDRQYTLKHLKGSTNLQNDIDEEWALMRELMSEFFIPVVADPTFRAKAEVWMADRPRFPWDTSLMKVIDNLVIGARKAT